MTMSWPDFSQIVLIMKLTAFFIIAALIQVSARSFGQQITLHEKNATVEGVLKQIEKQSNYHFLFKVSDLPAGAKVTVNIDKGSVEQVLDQCLANQPLSYTIINRMIVIRKNPAYAVSNPERVIQTIKGKITDEKGQPLPGASIKIKGTSKGVMTDADGNYSLDVDDPKAVLEFSFIGFEPQAVGLNGRTEISIQLKELPKSLSEIVVIGYGSVKKSDITGSVSSVSAEKLTQVKGVSNVAGGLQGHAAGVQVIERSGQPGESLSIKIRGTNSIGGGNDALYVVDGLPLDGLSSQLNPSDIESIEVLKDASSTAIYGSRGANGVVIITTKKGKEGKVKVAYSAYYGVQSLRHKIDVIGARDFANLQNEANGNWNTDNPGATVKKRIWTAGQIDSLTAQGTDWQNLVYQHAPVQNHDLSVSGGNADTRFYTSFGYFNQTGTILNSGFQRYSFRSNVDQKINERLSASVNLSLQQSNYAQGNYFNADGGGGIPFTTMVMPPTQGVYDANGKYTIFTGVPWGQTNPYAVSQLEYRYNPSLRILGNVQVTYQIADGLKFKSSAGIDNNWSRSDYYAPIALSLYTGGGASQSYGNGATFVNENLLNYTRNFGKHSLDVVTGFSYNTTKSQNLSSGTAQGFLTDIYQNNNINAASIKAVVSNGYNDNKLVSYLGRMNYGYAGKYLLTLTGRYDGSSRFSENHKYGFFPSGALGWRVSEESFMKNIRAISNLKLRGSYGLSGNQAIGNYQTLGQLSNTNVRLNNALITGYYLSLLENKNLKWETTAQFDLGLDLGLFNGRIEFTVDYYDKRTTDLLLNVNLPTSSGYSTVLQNVGAVGNKGYEFLMSTKNLTGAFTWNSTLTISHNRTKILDLGKDARGNPVTYKEVGSGGNWFPMILGQSMQQLFGYKVLGVYQTDAEAVSNGEPNKRAGDYKFQTTPGGVLPNDNRVLLSRFEPKFTFGFNNSFAYKNFSLSVLLVGSYGNDVANEFRKYNITLNGLWAPTQEAYDNRWRPGTGSNKYDRPQAANSGSSIRDYANSLWLENGSYLRVRDITLAYDFKSAFLKAIKLSSLQVYVSGQNLFTVTQYKGYDPEVANSFNGWDRGSYPSSKAVTAGVKANF